MKRNKNIDIIRGIAIITIIVYHIYAITGITTSIELIQTVIEYGGEYGVTVFFILSGFSIYTSIKNKGENFNYYAFICKRLGRILPQYYISLIILLLLTNMAVYLSFNNIGSVFSHIFLFHDLYPSFQGNISGVCWTLGVIFQFYLISPILYKLIEKRPVITAITAIIISVCVKTFVYHFILAKAVGVDISPAHFFGLGRTIFTTLDVFVLGMFLGRVVKIPENNKKLLSNIIGLCISLFLMVLWLFVSKKQINIVTNNTGIYSDCFVGYIWHSVLGVLLVSIIYFFSRIKILFKSPLSKFLLFVSKYEYGIYIWHLLIIQTLCQNSAPISYLVNQKNEFLYLILIALTVMVGAVFSEIFDSVDYKKIFLNLEKPIINVCKISIVIIIIFYVSSAFMKIPFAYNNFINIVQI